jgi:hypothetical protein
MADDLRLPPGGSAPIVPSGRPPLPRRLPDDLTRPDDVRAGDALRLDALSELLAGAPLDVPFEEIRDDPPKVVEPTATIYDDTLRVAYWRVWFEGFSEGKRGDYWMFERAYRPTLLLYVAKLRRGVVEDVVAVVLKPGGTGEAGLPDQSLGFPATIRWGHNAQASAETGDGTALRSRTFDEFLLRTERQLAGGHEGDYAYRLVGGFLVLTDDRQAEREETLLLLGKRFVAKLVEKFIAARAAAQGAAGATPAAAAALAGAAAAEIFAAATSEVVAELGERGVAPGLLVPLTEGSFRGTPVGRAPQLPFAAVGDDGDEGPLGVDRAAGRLPRPRTTDRGRGTYLWTWGKQSFGIVFDVGAMKGLVEQLFTTTVSVELRVAVEVRLKVIRGVSFGVRGQ